MNSQHIPHATILIVDDDPVNLSILFNYLSSLGFQVLVAQDGESALELTRNEVPDAILLDVLMPGLDGFETCRQFKQHPRTRDIPIIFMTALTNTRDLVTGFEMGAVDYITKPFTTEEILARLTTHLTINRQRRELDTLNSMKNTFFEIISQDMTGVLSSLVSLSDFLVMAVSNIPEANVREAAAMVERSIHSAIKLMDNLSAWAKIQNGTFGFYPEQLNLQELVLENIVQLRSHARAKQIALSYSVQPDTMVYTDYRSFSMILRNLLINAVWFTQSGGSVNVSTQVLDTAVHVTVADTGIGIPQADQPKLFRIDQKFQRPGTAGEHGSGLGLLLCKNLVEIGGGAMWLNSAVDRGSAFTFSLPRQPEAEA